MTYKNNPTQLNLINYKKIDSLTKKILKEEKRKNWRNYCSSLNKNTPMKEIWKKVNCYKNRQQENKNIISLDDPWIEDFSRNLTPYYVENQMSQDLATEDENELYLKELSYTRAK